MKKSLLLALFVASRALALEPHVVEHRDFDAGTHCELETARDGAVTLRYVTLSSSGGAPVRELNRACPEVVVELAAPEGRSFKVEASARVPGLPGTSTGWLPWQRTSADTIRVALPVDASAGAVSVRVVPGAPVPAGAEYALFEEPNDPAPLGSRTPVFLAHGFYSDHSLLPFDPQRNPDFVHLRAMPEYTRSFSNFKYYYFTYRPWASYVDVGAGMAAEIKKVLATAPANTPCIIIGRSGGALPARYAANDPEINARLLGEITLDGAMRGSVGSSLLHSNGKVAKKIGVPAYLLLKYTQSSYPFSPMLDSLTFDNFDGTIGADGVNTMGLMENTALRAFNESAKDCDRLVSYMGHVTNLWGWGDYHVKDEIYRRTLAAYDKTWGTADPLVHLPSGSLQGRQLRELKILPGRHHSEILTDPALMRMFLLDLYQFHRERTFHTLFGGAQPMFQAPN